MTRRPLPWMFGCLAAIALFLGGCGGAGSDCEVLAANPKDPEGNGDGVEFGDIHALDAIAICKVAVEEDPDDPRVQYHYARALSKAGRYAEAVEWGRKSANQGYAAAQNLLGIRYETGHGVEHNLTEAAKWFLKAAEHEIVNAHITLGMLYFNGLGVPKDYDKSVYWYQRAADEGSAEGKYNLGLMYMNGWAVKTDLAAALDWFAEAAEDDFLPAHTILGDAYADGHGVEKDLDVAAEWYGRAAMRGYRPALRRLRNLIEENEAHFARYTRMNIDEE